MKKINIQFTIFMLITLFFSSCSTTLIATEKNKKTGYFATKNKAKIIDLNSRT